MPKQIKILLTLALISLCLFPTIASAEFDPFKWTEDECHKTLVNPDPNVGFGVSEKEYTDNQKWYFEPIGNTGNGYCYGPAPKMNLEIAIPNFTPTNGRIGLPDYIGAIFKYAISIAGILAAVMIMVGGVMWVTSAGDSGRITTAKQYINSSVIGLVLLFCTYILLNTINPALVNLTPLKVKLSKNIQLSGLYCPTNKTVFSKDSGSEVEGSEAKCGINYEVQKGSDATCQGQNCVGASTGSICMPNINGGRDADTGKPNSACLDPKIACKNITADNISKWGVNGESACGIISSALSELNRDGACAWVDQSWLSPIEAGIAGMGSGGPFGSIAAIIADLIKNKDSCQFCEGYKDFKLIMDYVDPKKESCKGIFNQSEDYIDKIVGAFSGDSGFACLKAWCSDTSASGAVWLANGCPPDFPSCIDDGTKIQCAKIGELDCNEATGCVLSAACDKGMACVDKQCCTVNYLSFPKSSLECEF